MNIRPFLKGVGRVLKKNAGKILAGVAIGAEVMGFYFMHKEAPIVKERLDELPEDATWTDKIKVAGPVYLPAFGMCVVSIASIAGCCAAGEYKAALLSSLYSASEATLMQYEDQVMKKLGKEKAQEIHDAVATDLMRANPPTEVNVIPTGNGDQLFFEPLTSRYFTSSKLNVEAAVNRVNSNIISEMWASANEWFYQLGLEDAALGEYVGWNVDHNLNIHFTTKETPDQRSCFVIEYANRPVLYR